MNKLIKRKVQVVVFCKEPKQKVLLLQTNAKRNCIWQNITGSVDEGEEFLEAAYRELEEETGITKSEIIHWQQLALEYKFVDRWSKQVVEQVYFAQISNEKIPILDPGEHDHFNWVELDKISETSYNYKSNYEVFLKAKECFEE